MTDPDAQSVSGEDSPRLGGRDALAVLRVLGEASATDGDITVLRRRLMDRLAKLVGADRWAWALCPRVAEGRAPELAGFTHGGFSPEEFARYIEATDHPDTAVWTAGLVREMLADRRQRALAQPRFDPEDLFSKGSSSGLFAAAGVGTLLFSYRPLGSESFSVVIFFRGPGSTAFGTRDEGVVRTALGSVATLHEKSWPENYAARVSALSRRERMVLNLLVEGCGRDAIAAVLKISKHTVNCYMKSLYRQFGVRSRSRLLSLHTPAV